MLAHVGADARRGGGSRSFRSGLAGLGDRAAARGLAGVAGKLDARDLVARALVVDQAFGPNSLIATNRGRCR